MNIFQFKEFSVDQSHCAMKINTDGVLLGALAEAEHTGTILDIGTGTGVVALMLAQRFPDAEIEAVEIDPLCAATAGQNFRNSPFAERMGIHAFSFQSFFEAYRDRKFDLIASNPPFFIDSLRSAEAGKELARHTDESFFADLARCVDAHLSDSGIFWVILPVATAAALKMMMQHTGLGLAHTIRIHSFIRSGHHRELLAFNKSGSPESTEQFVIYDSEKEYSLQYRKALKNFLTIF